MEALAADDSGDEYGGPTADECQLDAVGELVPFPHEQSMQLGLELIKVFAADVVVTNKWRADESSAANT